MHLRVFIGLAIIVCINNKLYLARKDARRFSADNICPEKWTVFREPSSRKTLSFDEQIMSKNKYLSIFLLQTEVNLFTAIQTFFVTGAV